MWILDFGVGMSAAEAALYEAPFEYVHANVRPQWIGNKREAYAERWWLHVEPRSGMRAALAGKERFIATPNLAKHRLFAWLPTATLPDHQLIVFARDDDYTFGVLHSKVHELWALRMGTSLEDRPRYTPSTTFETFPFPRPTPAQKKAVALAAKELNEKRESWLNPYKDDPATGSPATGSGLPAVREELKKRTLTNLYNQMPEWLRLAHEKLDRAVLDAYGWPHAISDDEILARLLEENLKREAASTDRTDKPDEDEADEKPKRGKAKGKVKKK